MRTLVLGAGGTGGYFGGRLAEAGGDVTFLVRPRRAEQLRNNGLVVRSPVGDIVRPVKALTREQIEDSYDYVLLSCKAYDLDDAIGSIAPAIGANSTIIPILNGLNHLDNLAVRFGAARVVPALVQISITMKPDGEIVHAAPFHGFVLGERDGSISKRVQGFVDLFAAAKAKPVASAIIMQEMWEKFYFLCSLAAITCLMRASTADIARAPGGSEAIAAMLDECNAVAAASGFAPRPEFLARTRTMINDSKSSGMKASMLRDIERGGPVEADHIVGDMLARGTARGLNLPNLRLAYAALKAYESGRTH